MARVIVTAASSRYFYTLLTLLTTAGEKSAASVDGIVVWDLGLRRSQRSVLTAVKGVEVAGLPAKGRWPYSDWADPTRYRDSYAFKPFALLRSAFPGDSVLWLDAAVAVLRDLSPVFETIELDGGLLLDNPPQRNDRWTSSQCAAVMRATRAELGAPQIDGSIIGYRVDGPWRRAFDEWLEYSTVRAAFAGPRAHHRHDQTVLSILAARHGLPIAERPAYSWRKDHDGAVRAGASFLAHRRRYREVRLAPDGLLLQAALHFLIFEGVCRDAILHAHQEVLVRLRRVRARVQPSVGHVMDNPRHTAERREGDPAC